jgi:hypothetical protein
VFPYCKGDHGPRHVHVHERGRLVPKCNLDARQPVKGRATAQILRLLAKLEKEGLP